jgi:lipid A 3-O-deacylase
MKLLLKLFVLLIGFGIPSVYAQNAFIPTGYSLSYGAGRPGNLNGYRAALQWDWNWIGCQGQPIMLTGYWDASFAHWRADTTDVNQPGSINIIAFAPVFRFETQPLIATITPYIEVSVGLSGLSQQRLSHRNLGAHWSFQDLLGGGISFGNRQQYSLSVHYLHYSNAGLAPPNNGIDVKILGTFAYRFNC